MPANEGEGGEHLLVVAGEILAEIEVPELAADLKKVGDVMLAPPSSPRLTAAARQIAPATPLPEILRAFLQNRALYLYVGDEEGRLLGVIDLHDVIGYTDFFVICSGNTERQTKAIHDGIHQGMKGDGLLPRRVEGLGEARWILMDYLDVIVHVFTPDACDY